MKEVIRRYPWPGQGRAGWADLLSKEWLVSNGLGGYASGTVCGVPTRRFHGLLIAALPAPLGRTMMLNDVAEELVLPDGSAHRLGGEEHEETSTPLPGTEFLKEFRLDAGLPVWIFEVGSVLLEKRLVLPYRQNTVHVHYRNARGGSPVRMRLRPQVHFRPHEAPLDQLNQEPYVMTAVERRFEISSGPQMPTLRLSVQGADSTFTYDPRFTPELLFRVEESRGYDARGALWSAGYFELVLAPGQEATLSASTERWEAVLALHPREVLQFEHGRRHDLLDTAHTPDDDPVAADLTIAADQFIITPAGRIQDMTRARAVGEDVRTVIAGYHWFTDWGRDTMISLEGLTLTTGRHQEAGWILRTFAHYVRDGLIPNMFPEGENQGLYHTADATMWFFHAVARYLVTTGDRDTLRVVLPTLLDIVDHHVRGTHFGIGVDPADGLLRQGKEGYQLTWMDAKVDGWVVTPRRGKAVEINALWYNALRLLQGWMKEESRAEDATRLGALADRVHHGFNERFWYPEGGYLYDIVDAEGGGNDAACRPNQVFAISLDHPVLERERWASVMDVVQKRLLTPVGLRSLAPGHPDYKPRYYGDLRSRDAAYHQGTVWGWLIGPFVDAWLKLHPGDLFRARSFLNGFVPHLGEACVGSISEIFDAEPPYTPRGCVAQAWSVAEVLRAWVKTRG
jgi:predicted glycogen debranching enzyme